MVELVSLEGEEDRRTTKKVADMFREAEVCMKLVLEGSGVIHREVAKVRINFTEVEVVAEAIIHRFSWMTVTSTRFQEVAEVDGEATIIHKSN